MFMTFTRIENNVTMKDCLHQGNFFLVHLDFESTKVVGEIAREVEHSRRIEGYFRHCIHENPT